MNIMTAYLSAQTLKRDHLEATFRNKARKIAFSLPAAGCSAFLLPRVPWKCSEREGYRGRPAFRIDGRIGERFRRARAREISISRRWLLYIRARSAREAASCARVHLSAGIKARYDLPRPREVLPVFVMEMRPTDSASPARGITVGALGFFSVRQ